MNEIKYISYDEAIVYHIAASNIDDDLLARIMVFVVDCQDFDERLKLDIINAMQKSEIVNFSN
jgi:death-on-curing protein